MAAIQPPAALAIVVPTYNERDRLKDLVEKIASTYAAGGVDGEIVIVDDNDLAVDRVGDVRRKDSLDEVAQSIAFVVGRDDDRERGWLAVPNGQG